MKRRYILGLVVSAAAAGLWFSSGDNRAALEKIATVQSMKVVGNIAQRVMPDDVAGGFHNIPVVVRELAPNIYQATGIANTSMVVTRAGSVLLDTGIAIQAARHYELLREKSADAPVSKIVLSHSHADHIGGTKLWLEPQTEIITSREFPEAQRYLDELQPYFWQRNRTVFPWMPESPPESGLMAYGGIEPDILVTEQDYHFELGDTRFEVLFTPGAEGDDNIVLWLPDQKVLFSGDFFGPLFPQFPNIFTMRGEKIRKPMEYVASLNKLIALEPAMIVPSHHDPVTGQENLKAALIKMRDAVQYVHDETVKGMNAGKTVHQLMKEVQLPEHLQLTQEHGKVSWAVRSIWEYYATWFHFDSITELYPVPARDVYADLAELAGGEALIARAREHIEQQRLVKALHLLEVVLADDVNPKALSLRLQALNALLQQAINGLGNNYEKDYLRQRIKETEERLEELGESSLAT